MSQRQGAGKMVGAASPASPEASGGAGTVMEHRYGATLLAALVLHEPVPGLGGVLVPVKVAFQKADLTPVDDLVVTVEGAGAVVTWYVAARRKPGIGGSNTKTVALFATYLRLLRDEDLAFEAGTALLGLAVKGPHGPAEDLSVLGTVACAHGESAAFRRTIASRARPLRDRLQNVDDVVAAAARTLAWTPDVLSARDWSWTLLRALRVVQTFLDDREQDAVALTSRLATLVEGGIEQADTCRKELNALATGYANAGGDVAEADVRRRLVGCVRLASAPDTATARAVLTEHERELNLQTPRRLRRIRNGAPVELVVDRTQVIVALGAAMHAVGEKAGTLVIHGEPSVGKSVLTLEAVDTLRADGAAVTVLGLRSPLDAGVPLPRLFGALAVAPVRLLVLDGAEAVQEGGRAAFLAITGAAITAGIGVVAVTRDDAQSTVIKALQDVTGTVPAELTVEPLSVGDAENLVRSFPTLTRLLDRRSRWLLRRVGLVDLLLRGESVAPLRDGALSEADVFDACWRGWVRRGEANPPGGPSPEARELALLDVARERLGVSTTASGSDTTVLPSLRSDGLLLPYSPLRLHEDFPSDVVRDFATTRLLMGATAALLTTAGTPRWALRAARVSCQGRLVGAGAGAVTELERQLKLFDALGAEHGGRWGDVPWDAVLSSGVAPDVLRNATTLLLADRGRRLADLLRVAHQHFCASGAVIDPVLVEPLIAWQADHVWGGLDFSGEIIKNADELVVMWLCGVRRDENSDTDPATCEVRQRVRDAVLNRKPRGGDHELLEALATLGADLDDRVRGVLRNIAEKRPAYLYPVVENADAVLSLAQHDSALLAELSESYYVEQPRKDRWSRSSAHRKGVRSHRRLLSPRAAWWYGPFWGLLQADPRRGRALITTLLHHAANAKVTRLDQLDVEKKGLTVDLLGLGERTYVGDSHVYGWYRGSVFGPEPCTSALLACERMMDQLVAVGASLRRVALFLLDSARDLASVGLVIGFLIRHLDLVTDELDDFLVVPELWDLEPGRVGAELIGMRRVHDEDDVRGRHLRRLTFPKVAALLAARALEQRDDVAADRLRAVADRLWTAGIGDDGQPSLDVRMWTGLLDTTNYTEVELGSRFGYEYHEPLDVAADLHNERRELDHVHDMYGLINRYSLTLAPPFLTGEPEVGDIEQLRRDVALARELVNTLPARSRDQALQAMTAVAAAAVRVMATVDASALDQEDVAWVTSCVLAAARNPTRGRHADEDSMFSYGEDRSAAAVLGCLLLPAFDDNCRLTPLRLEANGAGLVDLALTSSTTSFNHEVRRITALGLRRLRAAPCGPEQMPCRHHAAWTAVKAGARDVAMTSCDASGAPEFTCLSGRLEEALRQANAEDLVLSRLSAALVSSVHAAAWAPCLATEASVLRDALLDAYARTAVHYANEGDDIRDEESAVVADALLLATDDDPTLLSRLVAAMGGCSLATMQLLEGVCTVATYDEHRRVQLRRVWPDLFATALDLPKPEIDKIFRGHVVAALVPIPRPLSTDKDIGGSLARARLGWPTAGQLTPLIERWLPVAAGERDAVSCLAGLLIGSPPDEQLRLGLPWIRRLVVPADGPPVLEGFVLIDLLKILRDWGPLLGEAGTHYDVIVDTLAAGGIADARELQQRDE